MKPEGATMEESIIIKGTRVDGKISGDIPLRVEGEASGEITLKSTLIIAQGGVSELEVMAENVVIEGLHSQGNINARESIRIAPTGSVKGNLKAPSVSIEKGAKFSGQIDMSELD
jgi:cytoskeletal protein CcmA (bactofilin family)